MYKSVVLAITLLLTLLANTPRAHACSGGPAFDDIFEPYQAFAQVEVLQTDLYGQNAILRVHDVLSGELPELAMLVRNTPVFTIGIFEDVLGGGDCNALYRPFQPGQRFYTNLYRMDTGFYGGMWFWFDFSVPETQYTTYLYDEQAATYQDVTFDEAGLYALVAQLSGQTPHPPRPAQREIMEEFFNNDEIDRRVIKIGGYPRRAILVLHTEAGTSYALPIDDGPLISMAALPPHENPRQPLSYEESVALDRPYRIRAGGALPSTAACSHPRCQLSPDGLFSLYIEDDKIYMSENTKVLSGQAAAFSPTGGLLARVDGRSVIVTSLGYFANEARSMKDILTLTDRVGLKPDLVWSSDGRRLAFVDDAGLWVIDMPYGAVSANVQPVLVSDDAALTPIEFSPLGSAIRVTDGSTRYLLTVSTGQKQRDGYLSPDERLIIFRDERKIIQACGTLAGVATCEEVRFFWYEDGDKIVRQAELLGVWWRTPHYAYVWACHAADASRCAVQSFGGNSGSWILGDGSWYLNQSQDSSIVSFDYSADADHSAWVTDDGTLFIDGIPHPIDQLSGLEAKLVGVEWMPSVWHR